MPEELSYNTFMDALNYRIQSLSSALAQKGHPLKEDLENSLDNLLKLRHWMHGSEPNGLGNSKTEPTP